MTKSKLKIGIVGCGAIGSTLARLSQKKFGRRVKVVALCDSDSRQAMKLKKSIASARVVSLERLIGLSDLVVESAGASVSFDIAQKALKRKKQVLVMSVGGVLGREKRLFSLAKKNKAGILFPSGAICGLDGIRALSLSKIINITLTTIKPPAALKGVEYLRTQGIDLGALTEDKVVFDGVAKEAVSFFPQNINVVAVLSLAAAGQVEPKVRIVASPHQTKNIHKIEVESDAASLEIKCENIPSPDNPKTSYLAILSALAVIAGILEDVRIGT